jgi:hypothetical protein
LEQVVAPHPKEDEQLLVQSLLAVVVMVVELVVEPLVKLHLVEQVAVVVGMVLQLMARQELQGGLV